MKNIAAVLILAVLWAAPATAEEPSSPRDGVFIHVSSGPSSPHRVLMALSMASIMSEDRDVLVYFDIEGIEVVLADGPDLAYKHFKSSHAALAKLSEQGVTLMACPGCLKAAGRKVEELADGVEVAAKNEFFSFTKGRILSLDY